MITTLFFFYGLCFGSFFTVVGLRVPKLESVVTPPSHCDGCHRRLTWFELLPVVSWLALRGRCRTCGVRIPVIYPAIELGVGLLFVLAWWRFGLSLGLFAGLCSTVMLTMVAAAAAGHGMVPNVWLWITAIPVASSAALSHPAGWWNILDIAVPATVAWYLGRLVRITAGTPARGEISHTSPQGQISPQHRVSRIVVLMSLAIAVAQAGLWLLTRP